MEKKIICVFFLGFFLTSTDLMLQLPGLAFASCFGVGLTFIDGRTAQSQMCRPWTDLGLYLPSHMEITAGNGAFPSRLMVKRGPATLRPPLLDMSEDRTQQQVKSSGDPPGKVPFSLGAPSVEMKQPWELS